MVRLNGDGHRSLDKKRNVVIAGGGVQDGGSFIFNFLGLKRPEHH